MKMDVIVDNCTICHQTTNILSDEEKIQNFVEIIQQIMPKKSLNITEFSNINIKLCLICCKKLLIANTQNELICNKEIVEKLKNSTGDCCQLCCNDQYLIKLDDNLQWTLNSTVDNAKLLCLDCFYYQDIITFVKNGLFKSFPKLGINPDRKRKMNKLLLNLEPVSKTVYKIPEDVYNDLKLYKKLPYIDLTTNNNHHFRKLNRKIVRQQSIKMKPNSTKLITPKFKIKLKNTKKTRKVSKSRIVKIENGKSVIGHPQNTSTPMKIDHDMSVEDETPKLNLSNNLSRRLSVIFDNTTNGED